ncbi:hypothetical protein [Chelatococcus sp. XZ-Ab1]|uniref:hypothetical protein n=1 Tax=Chelatococcus sp. XZ-Ab1 TaxID=3034027 RepID=UPI0023E41BA7|nr:hypothetical protein [Chelatococcus sp. XZ-Ab1]
MVLEEMERIAIDERVGPVIVNEATRLPYWRRELSDGWRLDRKKAGLPETLWNRDLRASAITEARDAGANLDDAARVAGHSTKKTTAKVYDRAKLEAARRFQAARIGSRDKPGT